MHSLIKYWEVPYDLLFSLYSREKKSKWGINTLCTLNKSVKDIPAFSS